MTPQRAAKSAGLVTLGLVALLALGRGVADGPWAGLLNGLALVVLLGIPLALAVKALTYRWRMATDLGSIDVAQPDDEWIAAVRRELAAVEDPRERRHFARAVIVVVVQRTLTGWTWLCAAAVADALALGLLGFSRELGEGGVGNFTLFVPPLVFFAVGAVAARRLHSFSRGLVVAVTAGVLSAIAMTPVAATEAAHWYSESGISFLDGEPAQVSSESGAIRDAFHPVFVVLHLLFWTPGIVLGAKLGARTKPAEARSAPEGA